MLPFSMKRRKPNFRSASKRTNRVGSTFERLEDKLLLAIVTLGTPSSNSGDGTWVLEQRLGVDVHVGPAFVYYNINPATVFPSFQAGDPLYVKVNYFDEGTGYVRVQYDSFNSNFALTNFHTRSSAADTQQFVSSYHILENAQFANGTNGNDFRVDTDGIPISTVEISDQPFPSSGLEWTSDVPWTSPYDGPSRAVDASTLSGKVLAGYQGWFNTPNDIADGGYNHWGRPGNWNVDQWPDPNDYDASELFAVPGVTTQSGDQAYLFSSANSSVVRRHFQWMRQHDIDGVFVQRFQSRFMASNDDGTYTGPVQWQITNVRDAAHLEGRTWAVEYDIQKAGDEAARDRMIERVKEDWQFLTDPNGMDITNDSHYQREDGKPVVAIFGLFLSSDNLYSNTQQAELVNWFKSQGVYVVGAGRHTQSASQIANAGLHDAYIPWQGYWWGSNSYSPAEAALSGVTEHIPHVFPGFSWTHLKNDSAGASVDREDGLFYWRMLSDAINETDAPWLFIGMFDEYDEATNLIPASDDPPIPDSGSNGEPLTFQTSEPMPNDWWMALTGAAKQALLGKVAIDDSIPTEADLENRSNVGGEARWQPSQSDRLAIRETVDSQIEFAEFTVDGQTFEAIYSLDPYVYFAVDDAFFGDATDGRDVTIEIEYLDSGNGQFSLEYDTVAQDYKSSDVALMTNSTEWRTHRFELSDAAFENGQNGGSDFRLVKPGGTFFVRRVSAIKESVLTISTDLGSANIVNGLQQIEQGDGATTSAVIDSRSVRLLSGSPSSLYMYFRVNDDFANDIQAGLNTIIEVVYQDVGTGSLRVQYDSTSVAYRLASPVSLQNTGEWRTARFYLDDAFFGNRQNGGSDFRLRGSNVPIDRVRVLRDFGDLISPVVESISATVNPGQGSVTINWAVTDDWITGLTDQWSEQANKRVQLTWSNNGGTTWNVLDEISENESNATVSSYNTSTGRASWLDQYEWQTSSLPPGSYQLQVTPMDGQGNLGKPVATAEFELDFSPALPGDYNLNGAVDLADYAVWRDNLGATVAVYTGADGNGDGQITQLDYDIWKSNFGQTLTPAAALASSALFATASSEDIATTSFGVAECESRSRNRWRNVHQAARCHRRRICFADVAK